MSRAAVSRRKRHYRDRYPEVPVGAGVVSPSVESVLAAIRAVDPELPWESIADALVPMFARRRGAPAGMDEPVTLVRPPGMRVGIGIDIGPALMHVVDGVLRGWDLTADEALDRAIANVRALCTKRRLDPVTVGHVDGVPTTVFQSGEGIASTLLLLPDQIVRRFGPSPQLLIAPMRDLLVSIPRDAGIEFATWLRDAFAEEDPNCLDLPIFSLVGGDLRIEPGTPGTRIH
jgi:hypothetical protein